MKISETSNHLPEMPRSKKAASKQKGGKMRSVSGGSEPVEFAQALAGSAETKIRLALDELMDKVHEQGEQLVRKQNFQELERYKTLVKAFLDKLVNQLYRLQSAGAPSARHRVYVILEKVDLQLESLAKDVLSKQATPLRILERLDQIKGMLLDLYK